MDFIDLMGYIGYICAMDKLHGIHAIYFPNIAWIPWHHGSDLTRKGKGFNGCPLKLTPIGSMVLVYMLTFGVY